MNKSPYPNHQVIMFWNSLIEHCNSMTACVGCPLKKQCLALRARSEEGLEVVPEYWSKVSIEEKEVEK